MNELAIVGQSPSQSIIDSMTLDNTKKTLEKINSFHAIVKSTLNPVTDFGIIPGTAKPTLLKPGAETVCMLFGLATSLEILSSIPAQLSKDTDFVSYTVKCRLYRNDSIVSEGIGTCNSFEKKYQSKDALDIANTVLKMAEKRALVDAVLHVASLSAVFTQDIEDMQDMLRSETTENMGTEEAAAIKISFGKNKGKTLGEVYKATPDWIDWYSQQNKQDPVIKKAIEVLKAAVKEQKEHKAASKAAPAKPAEEIVTEAPPLDDEDVPEFLRGVSV